VLGIDPFRKSQSKKSDRDEIYECHGDVLCPNPKCITSSPAERRYLSNKAVIVSRKPRTLRCLYCDTMIRIGFIGRRATKTYVPEDQAQGVSHVAGLAMFVTEEQAQNAGYHLAQSRPRRKQA
jgi:Aspartate carbamoyltransferase regulatory chain, metal binding domain